MSRSLYAYKTIFEIQNQKSLDDFWSYILFRLDVQNSEYVYDRFARLYNRLVEYQDSISNDTPMNITLQEANDYYKISIDTSIETFLKASIRRFSALSFPYHYDNGIFSYVINKQQQNDEHNIIQVLPTYKKHFDFISALDLDEMHNILERMQESHYETVFPTLHIDEINAYRTTFSYYSSHIKHYSQVANIAQIVAELSVILSLYPEKCLTIGNIIRPLLNTFLKNLIHWQETLFKVGGVEIDYMYDSLLADLSQIKVFLELYDDIDDDEESLDDIFDF